jgi:hypothetical protein
VARNQGTNMLYYAVTKLPLRWPFQHEIHKYATGYFQIPEMAMFLRRYGVSDVDVNNNTVTMIDHEGNRHTYAIEEMWKLSEKDPEFIPKAQALQDIMKDYPDQLIPLFCEGDLYLSNYLRKKLDQEDSSENTEETTTEDSSSSTTPLAGSALKRVMAPKAGVAPAASNSAIDGKQPNLLEVAYPAPPGEIDSRAIPPKKLQYSLPTTSSKFGASLPGAPSDNSGQRT